MTGVLPLGVPCLACAPPNTCKPGTATTADADLPGSDLLPYPLYGTVPELAAACSANPLCVAFTSSGLRGALKGRGALLNTTTLVDTASPGAQWTCTYIKYTGVWYRTWKTGTRYLETAGSTGVQHQVL